jgi:hypothetical protein
MNDTTQNLILEWLVGGLVTILLAVVAFMAKRWFDHVDSLQGSMDQLRESILGLSEKFVTQVQHDKDIEALRIFGRRTTDRCPVEGCPYEETAGGQFTLTGSGAKSLQHLIELSKKAGPQ